MSNGTLGRFLSLEFLGMLMLGGVAWGSLSADVDSHSEMHKSEMTEVKQEQKEQRGYVREIQKSVSGMESDMEHFKDAIERTEDRQEKILRILERQYDEDND